MSQSPKILAFSGSIRQASVNRKALQIAITGAQETGAEVTLLDLSEYPLPLYNGDLEETEGLPDLVKQLKQVFKAHSGLLIATPEYNSSYTPLLKNTLDWVSRAEEGEPALACYQHKVAGLVSASPGRLGGLRSMTQLRALLENISVMVIPQQVGIADAYNAFDEQGQLKNTSQQDSLKSLGRQLANTTAKLLI